MGHTSTYLGALTQIYKRKLDGFPDVLALSKIEHSELNQNQSKRKQDNEIPEKRTIIKAGTMNH